jgi:hypothetical protein
MTATGEHRRRRRRKSRQRLAAEGVETQSVTPASNAAGHEWRWLTFPVFAAFAAGAFLILLIAPRTNTVLYTVLFVGFLAAVVFSVVHVSVRWVRNRRS